MVQDRGGLQYTIAVKDAFSKAINDFKKGLVSAKAEFAAFAKIKKDSGEATSGIKKTTKAIDENKAALKEHQSAQKLSILLSRQRIAEDARQAAAEKKQIAENIAAIKKASAESAKASKDLASVQKKAAQDVANSQKAEQRRVKDIFDARNRAEREAAKISASLRKDQQRQAQTLAQTEQKQLTDQQRQLQAFASAKQRTEREAAKISASQRKDAEKQQALDPNFQAQKRQTESLKEEAIVRAQIGQLRAKAAAQAKSGDLIGASKSLQQVKELNANLQTTNRSATNVFFTFRRLVGILAVFTIARNVVSSFTELVGAGIKFNDNIVTATTSIAGLIAATGDVRDEFGKSVNSSKELALAQQVARKQVELLRQDALRTTATFEQLAETFQVAVAPGFAAGLDINEIRKLTVSISQAASAIGLEQNQLAEEVRSLLSGTIQARTTRIATALGITNADVKRLKESGQLFDFLQKKLEAFDAAAQQVARSTLSGISNLVKGAFQKILGDAAGPLFQNLLKLGNELFDKVLTVKDAAGNIQPNPEAVKAFQVIFDALDAGVEQLRTLGKDLGFKGLQDVFKSIGAGLTVSIQLAIGFSQTLIVTLRVVVGLISGIADDFGLTVKQLGQISGALGVALGVSVIWKNTLGLIGLSFGNIGGVIRALIPSLDAFLTKIEAAGGFAKVIGANLKTSALGALGLAAVIAVVLKGFELVAQAIFGLDLNLKDTVELLTLGLLGSLVQAIGFFQTLGSKVINFFSEAFQALADGAINQIQNLKILTAAAVGNQKELQALTDEQAQTEKDQDRAKQIRDAQFQVELKDKETQLAAKLLGIQKEIADVVGKRAGENAQGPGFDPKFDLDKFLKTAEAARNAKSEFNEFVPIISTASSKVRELEEAFANLDKEIRASKIEFANALKTGGLSGVGGQIQGIFNERDVKLGEDLRKIQETLKQNANDINAANARGNARYHERLQLGEDTGKSDQKSIELREKLAKLAANDKQDQAQITSLKQDQLTLLNAQAEFERVTLELAVRKAAILAAQATPGINRENVQATAELASQRSLLELQRARTDSRRAAVVQAQLEINLARTELIISLQQQQAEIAAVRSKAAVATGDEKKALDDLLTGLTVKIQLEEASGRAKLKGLELTKKEADLVSNGSLFEGLKRGFEEIPKELPTVFQAGINQIKGIVQSTSQFISEAIISAFDPTDDTSLEERIGRFLLGIAQQITQSLVEQGISAAITSLTTQTTTATVETTAATTAASIRTASATALTTAATAEVTAATTAASIRAASTAIAAAGGGLVPGLARGGRVPSLAHMGARAQGLAGGGKPRHIPASDTVPAWLTPGEFVVRRPVVDKLGVNFFRAVNRGDFAVPRAASPVASHALASGMASGGVVSTALNQGRRSGGSGAGSGDGFQILPVQVAGERELRRQLAGGKSAFLRMMRDNATTIKGIINRGGG